MSVRTITILLVVTLLSIPLSLLAAEDDPMMGTFKLNVEKSKLPPNYSRSITRQHDHPWLVLGYCWNKALGRDVQRRMVEDALSEDHRIAREQRFGFVIVRRYERRAVEPANPPSRGGAGLSSAAR